MAKPRKLDPSPPPGAPGSEAPVGFAPRDAARIGEATRAYERARKNSIIPRGGRRGGGGGVIFLAYTTSTVSVATGTLPAITPGSGTITILSFAGTATAALLTGQTVRCLFKTPVSGQSYAVASSKLCLVAHEYGAYWMISADC